MAEKPRETQAELHVVELKEKVNNSSLMKHPISLFNREKTGNFVDSASNRRDRSLLTH